MFYLALMGMSIVGMAMMAELFLFFMPSKKTVTEIPVKTP